MLEDKITTCHRVILFMDIHNYSIAAKELGRQSSSFIQQVYETLGSIIVSEQGEIIKYMGDAILAIFSGGSETGVVRCSMKLRTSFSKLVSSWGLPKETELEIGIGSGEVDVGTFGHQSLRQKDVFGQEVNCTVVIGHHRGIAITETVYDQVKADYETRRLPDLPMKWQDEPLKVWEIVE